MNPLDRNLASAHRQPEAAPVQATWPRLQSHVRYAFVVVVSGAALTAAMFWQARERAWERLKSDFHALAGERAALLENSLHRHQDETDALRRFLESSVDIAREEFRNFALPANSPSLQAQEWIPRVPQARRATFESAARREGLQDFQLTERDATGKLVRAGKRAEYFPVYFVEPLAGNGAVIGFDVSSEPIRRAALEQARDSGQPAVTGPIRLVQDTADQAGLSIFVPVFEWGQPLETVEQRRARLRGFALGVFRIADLINEAFEPVRALGMAVQLVDLDAPSAQRLRVERLPILRAGNASDTFATSAPRALKFEHNFAFGGRHFHLAIKPNDLFVKRHLSLSYWWIPPVGSLVTALLGLLVGTFGTQRQRAETLVRQRTDELRQSEERLRIVTGHARIGLVLVNPERQYIFANAAYAEMLNLPSADIVGQRVADVLAGVYEEQIRSRLDQAFAGERVDYELRRPRSDGEHYYAVTYEPIQDGAKVSHTVVVIVDITERKRAEVERQKFVTLADTSHEFIGVCDRYFNPAYVNAAGLRMVGLADLAAAKRVKVQDFFFPEDQPLVTGEFFPKVLREGHGEVEIRFRHFQTGEPIWMIYNVFNLRDASGAVVGWATVSRNIHDRKKAEVELHRSNRGLRMISEINQLIVHEREPQAILDGACRIAVEKGGFLLAWIGLRRGSNSSLELSAHAGATPDTLEVINRFLHDPHPSHAFSLRALETGAHAACNDIAHNPEAAAWREEALRRGYRALVSLPLTVAGRRAGVLVLYAGDTDFFDERELRLLDGLAADIGFALEAGQHEQARGEAETALRTSEARYRGLVAESLDVVFRFNRQGRLTFVNSAVTTMLGFSPDEVIGRPFTVLLTEASAKAAADSLQRRLQGDFGAQPVTQEYALRRKDGGQIVVEIKSAPLLDASGQPTEFQATARDITDRKRAEAALRESEERLNFALRTSQTGGWDLNLEDHTAHRTPEHDRIFGYDSLLSRWTYEMFLEHVLPEDRAEVDRRFREATAAQTDWNFECRIRRRDGAVRWIWAVGGHQRDASGKPRRMAGIVQDITARKHLEEQLRQSQKMEAVGQLAGGVAHDFNNILTTVLMNVGLLKENPTLNVEARDTLQELEQAAQRAADLTRQLLLFGRRSVMQVKVLDLNDVLTDLQKMLRRLLGEHIIFEVAGETDLPRIQADVGMIEQVIVNLCVNARDAMPQGGRLSLRTALMQLDEQAANAQPDARPGRFVCLSVTDTGCGIDEAALKRIFEPFFTTKPVGKGTGLGLATVHGIVRQHEGWVEVESAVGRGTTFRVFLPAFWPPVEAPVVAPPPPAVKGGDEAILLVEDDPAVSLVLTHCLRRWGYRVVAASDGPAAMKLWKEHDGAFDLLYTDVVMPGGLSGMELAARLRGERPGLKVILSSGYSAELVQQGQSPLPGVTFVPKPCAPANLAAALRACLDHEPGRNGPEWNSNSVSAADL